MRTKITQILTRQKLILPSPQPSTTTAKCIVHLLKTKWTNLTTKFQLSQPDLHTALDIWVKSLTIIGRYVRGVFRWKNLTIIHIYLFHTNLNGQWEQEAMHSFNMCLQFDHWGCSLGLIQVWVVSIQLLWKKQEKAWEDLRISEMFSTIH